MGGRSSQRKGRAAELELSRIFQGYGYPVEAGRAMSYGEAGLVRPPRYPHRGQTPGERQPVGGTGTGEKGCCSVRRLASFVPSAESGGLAGDDGAAGLAEAVP